MEETRESAPILPPVDELEAFLDQVRASDLSRVSVQKIFTRFSETVRQVPFILADELGGAHILRVRLNQQGEVFSSEKEISYRSDIDNITSFGRASFPRESVFYGTIVTTSLFDAVNTLLFETSVMFNEEGIEEPEEFIFTTGHWTATEDLRVSNMVYSERFISTIPDVRSVYDNYMRWIEEKHSPEEAESMKAILRFYSDEFAKSPIASHYDYLVSASYAQMMFRFRDVDAITYPSVRVDNQGFNIALTPSAVESKLEFRGAGMARAVLKGKKRIIMPIATASELGPLNTRFKWDESEEDDTDDAMRRWLASG